MDKMRVAMIDAAMVEMKNLYPPLSRTECARLIDAAWEAAQSVPVVGEPTDAAYKWMIANGVEPLTSLHKLGERLAAFLDEDQFSGCETLLLTAITAINTFVPVPAAELATLREKAAQLDRELRANDKMSHDHRVLMAKIGERDDRIHQLEKERDELRKLLEEARDDVNSILNDILVLGNYPHNQRRIQIQQELLAAIDAAIAQEGSDESTRCGQP